MKGQDNIFRVVRFSLKNCQEINQINDQNDPGERRVKGCSHTGTKKIAARRGGMVHGGPAKEMGSFGHRPRCYPGLRVVLLEDEQWLEVGQQILRFPQISVRGGKTVGPQSRGDHEAI